MTLIEVKASYVTSMLPFLLKLFVTITEARQVGFMFTHGVSCEMPVKMDLVSIKIVEHYPGNGHSGG